MSFGTGLAVPRTLGVRVRPQGGTASRLWARDALRSPLYLERTPARHFSASFRHFAPAQSSESYGSRLGKAWRNTRIQWKPIPVGLGIGFLGFTQLYRVQQREKRRQQEEDELSSGEPEGPGGRPKKRKKVRPSGPWTVQIMSYLPLKRVSRVWGWFNELTIPYYLRVPGFKLYSWVFGVKYASSGDCRLC